MSRRPLPNEADQSQNPQSLRPTHHPVYRTLPPVSPAPPLPAGRPLAPAHGPRLPPILHSGSSSPAPSIPKRKTVKAACEGCRARRTKCDGERPSCSNCISLSQACVYVTKASESRGQATKRKLDDTQAKLSDYEQVFTLIRTKPLEESSEIFRRIRTGHDPDAVLRHIRDGDLLLQMRLHPEKSLRYEIRDFFNAPKLFPDPDDPYLRSPIFRPPEDAMQSVEAPGFAIRNQHIYQTPYHSTELVDPRLSNVDASYWTSVTSDNTLVAKLISLYLLTDYAHTGTFPKDLFLDDLVKRRKKYCSSLLVNAICAAGMENPVRAEWWRIDNLRYSFMAEAKRLYELELGQDRLTNLQAASIISLRHIYDGQDKVGMTLEADITAMTERLRLYDPPSTPRGSESWFAQAFTAWSNFSVRTMVSFYMLRRPAVAALPEIPLPSYENANQLFGELWLRYPGMSNLTPRNHGCHRLALIKLRILQHNILLKRYPENGGTRELTWEQASECHDLLEQWLAQLPDCLQPETIALPADIDLHCDFQYAIINLYEPWISPSFAITSPTVSDHAIRAQARLESLLRLYYLRHSFVLHDVWLLPHLLLVGSVAIRSLPPPDSSASSSSSSLRPTVESNNRNASTLILCAKGLHDHSLNNYVSMLFFQLLQDGVDPADEAVLKEFANVRAEFHSVGIKPEHVYSKWPVYKWIDEGREEMGRLVKATEWLAVDEDTDMEAGDGMEREG